jgi:hypothetical protein
MRRVLMLTMFMLISLDAMCAECSDLAIDFSTNSDTMDVNDLALLRKCITTKLREKLSASLPMPAPEVVPHPAMSPPPQPVPPIMPAPPR